MTYQTLIHKCNCPEEKKNVPAAKYQDEIYGEGVRVFTKDIKGEPCHCTVCGKKYEKGSTKKK